MTQDFLSEMQPRLRPKTQGTPMSQPAFKQAFVVCTLVALANAAMVLSGFVLVPSDMLHETHLPAYAIGAAMWAGLASAIYSRHWSALIFVGLLVARGIFSAWQIATTDLPQNEPLLAPYVLYVVLSVTMIMFVGEFVLRAWRKGYLK